MNIDENTVLKYGASNPKILVSATHPLRGPELRALRQLQREYPDSAYLFISERKAAMAAATARGNIERAGKVAGLPLSVHPHMLRHSCGFYLASKGHDTRAIQVYLGHKNIQHTVRYTELSPERFKSFWTDRKFSWHDYTDAVTEIA